MCVCVCVACMSNWCGMKTLRPTYIMHGLFLLMLCTASCLPQANQVYILDRPVFFNFSTSQEITRSELVPATILPATLVLTTTNSLTSAAYTSLLLFFLLFPRSPYGIIPGGAPPAEIIGSGGSGGSGVGGTTNFGENHILLFTIFNPLYPITVVREACCGRGV